MGIIGWGIIVVIVLFFVVLALATLGNVLVLIGGALAAVARAITGKKPEAPGGG